uniref:Synaptonemal complex protein 1 n=1 Tax=Callorhinchus milii TaxID=7868 RepID=A0A4W3HX94_CALMI
MQMEAKMVGERVKENPFKLYVPHPLSCGPVSAVKPVADDSFFMQTSNGGHKDDLDLHVLMTSTPKFSKSVNQDFTDSISLKPRVIQEVEKENSEQISQLYTKLFHEAEKINRWKLAMDNELSQKDKKLQENKHTIEVQRKAIQEQQFENENLSIRLEEAISKNEESTKKHNATRDLFSIVKEACARLSEKMKTYETEREESKGLYAKNAENIEKMVMAFEELRFQSENAKKEIMFKLKEDLEQREKLKNEHQHQLNDRECKVEQLQQEYKQKDNELQETLIHLQESKIRYDQLKEETRQCNEDLQKSQVKVQHLTAELEKTDDLLKKKETSEKSLEEKFENMKNTTSQLTRENEITIEEFNKVILKDALTIAQLTTKTEHLEELFRTEQERAKELQDDLQCASTELEKKNNALGQLEQLKTENKVKISQFMEALENASKAQLEWEEQLQYKQTENGTLLEELKSVQKTQSDLEDKVKLLADEKAELQKNVDALLKEATYLKEAVQNKENVIDEIQRQILSALEKEEDVLEKIDNLKVELKEEREKREALSSDYNIALEEKEIILHNITNASEEIKNLQKNLEAIKQKEAAAKKTIQILKDQNALQNDELCTLKETLKQQDEVTGSKLEEQEESSKNLQNEFKKKERALKAMESKLNTLKKQLENKNESIEVLQKEGKSLKKQIVKETSQCSAYKTEIEQLKRELINLTVKHKDSIQDLQNKIEEQMYCNEKLNEEVQTLQLTTEEAIQAQKKNDVVCQHKISEIITLMEKHKVHIPDVFFLT